MDWRTCSCSDAGVNRSIFWKGGCLATFLRVSPTDDMRDAEITFVASQPGKKLQRQFLLVRHNAHKSRPSTAGVLAMQGLPSVRCVQYGPQRADCPTLAFVNESDCF